MRKFYEIPLNDGTSVLAQTMGRDSTQLHADIFRVYKTRFETGKAKALIASAQSLEIDFHALVLISLGKKLKIWHEVMKSQDTSECNAWFRMCDVEDGRLPPVSKKWWLWKVNQPMKFVGALTDETRKAEIGSIVVPPDILHRITTGKYSYFHSS